ncbi:MAG: glycosyltransferase family 39 protein [bacterium]
MKKKRATKEKKFSLPSFFTKEAFIVAGLLVLALILRLIYLAHLKVNDPSFYLPPDGTDMLTYHNYAKQILSGTFGKEPYYYGPLYSYFLALVYKIFGIDPYIARLIQMLLGVATSFLIYLIAKKVFNKAVALISISISIFYGMFYIHEGVLLMESLVTFLNTLSIFLLLRTEDNPSYKNIALSGIAIGLSALARANILLFVPLILIWLLIPHPFSLIPLKKFAFLCLVIALIISPATIRNYLTSGRFVLISTNGPVSLWIGNNPYAEGWFAYPPPEYSNEMSRKAIEKGDKAYTEEVLRFAKEYPGQFFGLLFNKFLLFWDRGEIENNISYTFQKGYSFLFKFPLILGFVILSPLALLGILLSLRKQRCLLLQLAVFSFMIAIVLIFITARYRISILPLLIVFASFAIYWWYEKLRKKRFGTILLSISLLFLSLSLSYSQSLKGRFYPIIHPEGIHIERNGKVTIKDNTSYWPGKKSFVLQNPENIIKKEIAIKEDIINFREAILSFMYFSEERAELAININDKVTIPATIDSGTGLIAGYQTRIGHGILKKGINTITIKPLGGKINILVDETYTFKRSWLQTKKGWKRLKDGEYMVWLSLSEESSIDKEAWVAQCYDWAKLYLSSQLYNEAAIDLKLALMLTSPNNKERLLSLHTDLCRLYYETGKIDGAIEECKKIIAIDPINVQAHNNLIGLQKMLDK